MPANEPHQQPATVLFHLDHGYSRIRLDLTLHEWDVPTKCIPNQLHQIGSKLLVTWNLIDIDTNQPIGEIRQAQEEWMRIEELPEAPETSS